MTEITLETPIKNYSDIQLIKDYLDGEVKDSYGHQAETCIMNYIELQE